MHKLSGKDLTENLKSRTIVNIEKALSTLNHSLTRLINENVDHEISDDADLINAYLKASPECADLFALWEYQLTNSIDRIAHVIINAIARIITVSKLLDARPTGSTVARSIIRHHIKQLYRNLSSGNPPLIQATLRLLTAIADFSTSTAKELHENFNFTMKALPKFLHLRHKSSKDASQAPRVEDVRTSYIRFLLAFLKQGDGAVKKFMLEAKDLLSAIFKGMSEDSYETVDYILSVLRRHVIDDNNLSRTAKVAFFNNYILDQLARLYARNDTPSSTLTHPDKTRTIADVVHDFLLYTCTIPGIGICFQDVGWYPARSAGGAKNVRVYNKVLLRLLLSLKPTEDPRQEALLLAALKSCPELVQPYWRDLTSLSFEPRVSAQWLANMALIAKVIQLPIPQSFGASNLGSAPPPIPIIADNILPRPLDRSLNSRALQHSNGLIKHTTAVVLTLAFEKLARVEDAIDTMISDISSSSVQLALTVGNVETLMEKWSRCKSDLLEEMRRRVPDLQIVLALQHHQLKEVGDTSQQTMKMDVDESEEMAPETLYCTALRLLRHYQRQFPDAVIESRVNYGKLLPADLTIVSSELQLHLLELIKEIPAFNWKERPAQATSSHLASILRLYLTASPGDILNLSFQVIHRLLSESFLFQYHIDEISPWLTALRSIPKNHLDATLAWLDEALCTGARTPYRVVDRLGELLDQCDAHMPYDLRRAAEHILITRNRAHLQDSDLSDVPPFPFSPAMVCVADGLQAVMKKRADETIGPARFFFQLVVDVLHGTQGTPQYLLALVRRLAEVVIPKSNVEFRSLESWESEHYVFATQVYLQLHCSQSAVAIDGDGGHVDSSVLKKKWKQVSKALQGNSNDAADSFLAFLDNISPLALDMILDKIVPLVSSYSHLLPIIRDYLVVRHPVAGSLMETYVYFRDVQHASDEHKAKVISLFERVPLPFLIANMSLLSTGPFMDYEQLVMSRIQTSDKSDEFLGLARQVLMYLQKQNGDTDAKKVKFYFRTLAALLGTAHRALEQEHFGVTGQAREKALYNSMREIVFGHPLLLEKFLSQAPNDQLFAKEILALAQHALILEASAAKEGPVVGIAPTHNTFVWSIYCERVRDQLRAEMASGSVEPATIDAFSAFSSHMMSKDLDLILRTVLDASDDFNHLLPLVLTASRGEGRTMSAALFRRLLRLMTLDENLEVEQTVLDAVKCGFRPSGCLSEVGGKTSLRVSLSYGEDAKGATNLFADVPSLFDEKVLQQLFLAGDARDSKNRIEMIQQLLVASPVIRSWLVGELSDEKIARDWSSFKVKMVLGGLVMGLSEWEQSGDVVYWSRAATDDDRLIMQRLHDRVKCLIEEDIYNGLLGTSDSHQALCPEMTLRIVGLYRHEYGGAHFLRDILRRALERGKPLDHIAACIWLAEHLHGLRALIMGSDALDMADLVSLCLWVLRRYVAGRKKVSDDMAEDNGERAMRTVIRTMGNVLKVLRNDHNAVERLLLHAELVKGFLVVGMKHRICDPGVIQIAEAIIQTIYDPKISNASAIRGKLPFTSDALCDMIVSHSQFPSVVCPLPEEDKSTHAHTVIFHVAKPYVLHLLYCIMSLDPLRCCKTEYLPQLAHTYHGTAVPADRIVLAIWSLYEKEAGISVEAYAMRWDYPGSQGLPAANAMDIVAGVDPVRMAHTCQWFPVQLDLEQSENLDAKDKHDDVYSSRLSPLYDPAFFLPVVARLLVHGNGQLDVRRLVESNLLGLAVMSLSSEKRSMRKAGYFILDIAYKMLYEANFKERNQILLILEGLKNAITVRRDEEMVDDSTQRVPSVIALFIAQGLMVALRPENEIYPLVNRFFLQRPIVDVEDIPMFYDLFYSSSDNARRERIWMLRLLSCGLKSSMDYRLYKRRHVLDILMGFFASPMSDGLTRKLIMEMIMKGSCIPSVISDMITQSGLLTFLHAVCATLEYHPSDDMILAMPRILRLILQGFCRSSPEWHGTRRVGWLESIAGAVLAVVQGIINGIRRDKHLEVEAAVWWCNVTVETVLLLRDILLALEEDGRKTRSGTSPIGFGHVADMVNALELCKQALPEQHQNPSLDIRTGPISNSSDAVKSDMDSVYSIVPDIDKLLRCADACVVEILYNLPTAISAPSPRTLATLLRYSLDWMEREIYVSDRSQPWGESLQNLYLIFLSRLQTLGRHILPQCLIEECGSGKERILPRLVNFLASMTTQTTAKRRALATLNLTLMAQSFGIGSKKRKREDDAQSSRSKDSVQLQAAGAIVFPFRPTGPHSRFLRKLLHEELPRMLPMLPRVQDILGETTVETKAIVESLGLQVLAAIVRRLWGGEDDESICAEEALWRRALGRPT